MIDRISSKNFQGEKTAASRASEKQFETDICAIILAAGPSTRMGRPKQLIPLNGQTLLETVITTAKAAGLSCTLLVLGSRAREIIARINHSEVRLVINKKFRGGLSSSLRAGLKALPEQCNAVLMLLGDMPFVSSETLRRLMEAYIKHSSLIVIPVYRGRRGNPVLFDRQLFAELAEIRGDQGGRGVIDKHKDEVLELSVEDPFILLDIDDESDLKHLLTKISSG